MAGFGTLNGVVYFIGGLLGTLTDFNSAKYILVSLGIEKTTGLLLFFHSSIGTLCSTVTFIDSIVMLIYGSSYFICSWHLISTFIPIAVGTLINAEIAIIR